MVRVIKKLRVYYNRLGYSYLKIDKKDRKGKSCTGCLWVTDPVQNQPCKTCLEGKLDFNTARINKAITKGAKVVKDITKKDWIGNAFMVVAFGLFLVYLIWLISMCSK